MSQSQPKPHFAPKPEPQSTESHAVAFFLLSLTFALFTGAVLYVISSPQLHEMARYEATVRAVIAEYPGDIDGAEFFNSSADAVYGTLDRYSRYAPAQAYDQIVEEYSGAYAGIGVSIVAVSQGLLVASVNPAGPAIAAGIKPGDVIIRADSISLIGKSTFEASRVLRGREGDSVKVALLRPEPSGEVTDNTEGDVSLAPQSDTLSVSIVRTRVPLSHVTQYGVTVNNSLYIRLNDFGAGAEEQFVSALDSLRKERTHARGILIDLRNNPGGLLNEALRLADYFLPDNALLLGEKGKSRWSRREFHGWSDDHTNGAPVVIMVNRNSASASEVFSGSLKFAGRAILVGDTTFGKGLVQEYKSLPDGSASKLTVGRYYFTGEQYLNQPGASKVDSGSGIAPDVIHQFSSENPLIRALSAKMLFITFAARFQDEIISAYESATTTDDDDLLSEFRQAATLAGVEYKSDILRSATDLYLWTTVYETDRRSRRISDDILRKAEELEKDLFKSQAAVIMRHLARAAYERRDGAKAAFNKVTLPTDPDISACDSILIRMPHRATDTTRAGA